MNTNRPTSRALLRGSLLGFSSLLAGGAGAADNFTATYTDLRQQQPVQIGAPTLSGIFRDIALPTVPVVGAAESQVNLSLRGTAARVIGNARPTSGDFDGRVTIAATGAASPTFVAPTWSAVLDQIREFLLQPEQARALAREAARTSPFDPVAGNPSSQMARMVAFDFGSAFFPFASNIAESDAQVAQAGGLPAGAVRGPLPSLPGLGLQVAQWRDSGQTARALALPLSMTWRSDLDPRRQVSLYLPLAVTDVNGARTTQGTAGAALRLPLARDWAVSGNVGYSILKATDLGAAGKMASVSLTSSYVFRTGVGDLAMGNMVGRYETLSGTVGGIDTGSGIANTVFRNGLLWSTGAPDWLGGFGRSVEFTLVNTHYTGSELYLDNYTEIGLTLGTNRRADSQRSYMQGGLSFVASSKTTGVMAHYGYWF